MENKKHFKEYLGNKILKSWLLNTVISLPLIILFLLVYRVGALTEYRSLFGSILAGFLIAINLGLKLFWKKIL